jgi:hypothetical protein
LAAMPGTVMHWFWTVHSVWVWVVQSPQPRTGSHWLLPGPGIETQTQVLVSQMVWERLEEEVEERREEEELEASGAHGLPGFAQAFWPGPGTTMHA